MSELYYRNLGEFDNIGLIMKDVFDGLNPFYRYLSSVREYLEGQIISFNFVHLDGSPVEIEDEQYRKDTKLEKLPPKAV